MHNQARAPCIFLTQVAFIRPYPQGSSGELRIFQRRGLERDLPAVRPSCPILREVRAAGRWTLSFGVEFIHIIVTSLDWRRMRRNKHECQVFFAYTLVIRAS
ncbi:hypothetical protein CHELA1G11_11347 [Hyphomicrobiales bacterium]|nr:hypothetical protein CHELA1G11_11347 [Hyphomicrobiales bacterium]CAH1668402.1 hypothetical protein CHELA1G2_12962 [Hyphomicrobiales bacterium]